MQSGLLSDLGLAVKAYRDTFVFRGRSTRTEMLSLLIVAALIGWTGAAALEWIGLPIDQLAPFGNSPFEASLILAVGTAPFLPMIALLFRRAHDFGWSGWPSALLGSAGLALSLWRSIDIDYWYVHYYPEWMEYLRTSGLIGFYGTLFWNPSRGDNLYGPDPRLDLPRPIGSHV